MFRGVSCAGGESSEVRSSRLLACLDEFIRQRCHTSLSVSSCLNSVDRDLLTSGWQEASFISDTTTIFVYALLRHCLDERVDAATSQLTNADQLRTLVHVCCYLTYTYVGPEISYPLRPFLRGCCRLSRPLTAAAAAHTHNDEDSDNDDHVVVAGSDDEDDDDDDEDIVVDHSRLGTQRSWGSSASSGRSDVDIFDECRHRFWVCCTALIEHCSWLMLQLNSDSELYAMFYRQLTSFCPIFPRSAVPHLPLCREP